MTRACFGEHALFKIGFQCHEGWQVPEFALPCGVMCRALDQSS